MLDDGQLNEGMGRKIDFKNTMIIRTSNIGARQLEDFGDGGGFATASRTLNADENNKAVIEKALKRTFSPEFLNRIDKIVVYRPLNQPAVEKIVELHIADLQMRLQKQKVKIKLPAKALSRISELCFSPYSGALAVQRVIQELSYTPLAGLLLRGQLKEGQTVAIGCHDKDIHLEIVAKK